MEPWLLYSESPNINPLKFGTFYSQLFQLTESQANLHIS